MPAGATGLRRLTAKQSGRRQAALRETRPQRRKGDVHEETARRDRSPPALDCRLCRRNPDPVEPPDHFGRCSDDWKTNETGTGIEINSADNSVYLAIDVASPKKTGDMIDEAAKFLDKQGVTIDEKTQKYTEDKLNGKDIIYIEWAGKDKDGPASVGLAALVLDEKTVAVLTYWGTPGQEEKNTAAVGRFSGRSSWRSEPSSLHPVRDDWTKCFPQQKTGGPLDRPFRFQPFSCCLLRVHRAIHRFWFRPVCSASCCEPSIE